jgi:SAM-dependent methyltransferase
MADATDAFGRALSDWARGKTDPETFERDDGYTETGVGHELYVADFPAWLPAERRAVRYIQGRVVDVGCAAGRVPLYLQDHGHDVVGVDSSALAVRTAAARGVEHTWCMSAEALTTDIGSFDTIVLFGNNFGIFGTPDRIRRVLTSWARRTRPGTRILAESTNPYCGGAPVLTRSHYFDNRRRGLMPGQAPSAHPLPGPGRSLVHLALRLPRRDEDPSAGNGLAPEPDPRGVGRASPMWRYWRRTEPSVSRSQRGV